MDTESPALDASRVKSSIGLGNGCLAYEALLQHLRVWIVCGIDLRDNLPSIGKFFV